MVTWALILLVATLWAVALVALRARRRWLPFYLGGAFGLILLTVAVANVSAVDTLLESIEVRQTIGLAALLGIRVGPNGATGLAIPNHVGWAVFGVGIECSALIEMAAVLGLVAFYPPFGAGRRVVTAIIGLAYTYVMNLARILLIVAIINSFGTGWVFAAHAVFGRVFFFVATVVMYWYLVTRPTIGIANARLRKAAADA